MAVSKNMSKVIFGDEVLVDLTADTATADKVAKGLTFHTKDGQPATGTSTLDSDTTDATASVAEILKGKTAYVRGAKVTGTMPNNGGTDKDITTKDQVVNIPMGYNDGSGTVQIATIEKNKLIPNNIREGVTVLGVVGKMSGMEDIKAQSKTATPAKAPQTILPDEGFNYLSQVTIAGIPYEETANSAGGTTVKIG